MVAEEWPLDAAGEVDVFVDMLTSRTVPCETFLPARGDVARTIRAHDWSATVLGEVQFWPKTLTTLLGVALRSPAPMGLFWGAEGLMLYNDAFAAFLGDRHPALLGTPVAQAWPDLTDFHDNVLSVVLAGGALSYNDAQLTLERGGRKKQAWADISYSPVLGDDGTPAGVLAIVSETTERVTAEQARRESEERLRLAVEGAQVGLWDWDLVTVRGWWSPRTAEIMGVEDGEAVTLKRRHELVHPEDRQKLREMLDAALATGNEFVHDYRIKRPDGAVRSVSSRGIVLRDAAGRAIRTTGIVLDVTEDHEAAALLRESEARLRRAQEAGGIGSYEWDLATGRGQLSDSMLRIAGLEPGRSYSLKEILATVIEEDRTPVKATVDAIGDGTERRETEYRVKHPDNSTRWIRDTGQLERDSSGKPLRWAGVVQDITERKLAEQALRANRDQLAAILDATPAAILIANSADCSDISGNARALELMRMPKRANLSRSDPFSPTAHFRIFDTEGNELRAEELPVQRAARGEELWMHEERVVFDDGAELSLLGNAVPLRSGGGNVVGAVGAFIDISDRKRAEEHQQLLLNELNHRVKNTLAIVQALAQQSFKSGAPVAQSRAAFEARLAALSAAHNLLTRDHWESANLAEVIAVSIAAATGEKAAHVHANGPDLQLAPQTAVSMAMAVHELCTNAVKHGALSQESGRVEIEWRVASSEGGDRLHLLWREAGGPSVRSPEKRGFGSRMIERGLAGELRGEVRLDFAPEGLCCRVDAPLPRTRD